MKKIIILTMFLVTAIYFFRVVLVTDSNQDSNINNSDRKDGEFVMDTADYQPDQVSEDLQISTGVMNTIDILSTVQ